MGCSRSGRNAEPRRRWSRRVATAVVALTVGGVLGAAPAPARAGGLLEEPCFATCGQYKWFLNHSIEVRDSGACCMTYIRQAKVKEEKALDLYEAARDPSNSSQESSDLVREANRMIAKRTKKIRQFIDCVNGVIRAVNMQKRGDDPTAEYAAACGLSLQCEGEQ